MDDPIMNFWYWFGTHPEQALGVALGIIAVCVIALIIQCKVSK